MRPESVERMVGQEHLLGQGKLLATAIEQGRLPSFILWGPPGTGKTTLARAAARRVQDEFVAFSAVLSGVPELRKAIERARELRKLRGRGTVLFIDEIHRFNKAQQDALLPHVERGTVVLIGATTENPSFAVNAALLSRARVFRLEPLASEDLLVLLGRALTDVEKGLGGLGLEADAEALQGIAEGAKGDARRALDLLEAAARHALGLGGERKIDLQCLREALAAGTLLYDKSGEEHYNTASAFIKSMRGSDPDAAIYWMMRMLEAGDDPLFVARRMIIFAGEDIGNADPAALRLAVAADQALQRLGMPEGVYPLAECCLYLASAPKSNAATLAWTEAQKDVKQRGSLPVPLRLRNPVTEQMREWGYGGGYRYPHSEGGYAPGEVYLPDELRDRVYYRPTESGIEARIKAHLQKLRVRRNHDGDDES
jgi:putative ATPase